MCNDSSILSEKKYKYYINQKGKRIEPLFIFIIFYFPFNIKEKLNFNKKIDSLMVRIVGC